MNEAVAPFKVAADKQECRPPFTFRIDSKAAS